VAGHGLRLGVAAALQPAGELHVDPAPLAARHRLVGDVTDQHVFEAPAGAERDQQVATRQVGDQPLVHALRVDHRQLLLPERATDHGRPLHEALLLDRQQVEARGDHALHGQRHRVAALRGHRQQLLEEEWVAAGQLDRLPRILVVGRQRSGQALHLGLLDRVQRDNGGVTDPGAPVRPRPQQIVPGHAEDHQRPAGIAGGKRLDQVEQRRLSPVHVLEHHQHRLQARQRRQHQTPGIAAAAHVLEVVVGRRRRVVITGQTRGAKHVVDLPLAAVAQQRSQARLGLTPGLVTRRVAGDVRSPQQHIRQRRVGAALAVGQAAPQPHDRRLRLQLQLDHDLLCQPALADAGLADHRDQMRTPVLNGARHQRGDQ
jgi:hypothetical protein